MASGVLVAGTVVLSGVVVPAEILSQLVPFSGWQIVSLCGHSFSLKNHVSEDEDIDIVYVDGNECLEEGLR